ncbi:MAG: PIN domain-containing protein [Bosea sp. (in: a-proteobacteria)]
MLAIDTNVLLRYVVDDGDPQREAAVNCIDSRCSPTSPAFVSLIVLVEFVWVLTRLLKRNRAEIIAVVTDLVDNEHLLIEQVSVVETVIEDFTQGRADFADHLIAALAKSNGASPVLTFNTTAASEPGFELLVS